MTSAIVHLSVVNDSAQELVFQEQIESVVCAVALDNLTVEAATKDCLLLFYAHCGRFVSEKRYGQMFSGELERRVSVMLPHCYVTAKLDERTQQYLENVFLAPAPTEKAIRALWEKGKMVQKYCRKFLGDYAAGNNIEENYRICAGASPTLCTHIGTKQKKSGVYDDNDLLKQILKAYTLWKIDENKRKNVSDRMLKAGKNFTAQQTMELKESIIAEITPAYEIKKARWENEKLPAWWLSFILTGSPGKNFTSMRAEAVDGILPKSKEGRRYQRQQQEQETGIAGAKRDAVSAELKEDQSGDDFEETSMMFMRKRASLMELDGVEMQIRGCMRLIQLYETLKRTEDAEYLDALLRYEQLLKLQVFGKQSRTDPAPSTPSSISTMSICDTVI